MLIIVTHTLHTADDQFGGQKFRAVRSVCQKLNKGSGLPPNWGFICDRDREGVEGKRKEEADGGAEGALPWPRAGPDWQHRDGSYLTQMIMMRGVVVVLCVWLVWSI